MKSSMRRGWAKPILLLLVLQAVAGVGGYFAAEAAGLVPKYLERARMRCARTAPIRGGLGSDCGAAADELALFEFAPASGQGITSTACGGCDNLIWSPEAIGAASGWALSSAVVAAPTLTANFAAAPNGPLTADRFQLPAVAAGGAEYSRVCSNGPTAAISGNGTLSVSAKGTSGSGNIGVCIHNGTTWACQACAFTSTDWTRCEFSRATASTVCFGNGIDGVARPATDVLLWGGKLESGSPATAYVPLPLGAKSEILSFTRASTAWCSKGNETTGIANGDLVHCRNEQPKMMPGGDGTGGIGLNAWEARTNAALRSNEFDNATEWIPSGVVVAAPTVTANAATAPDGTLTADRVNCLATTAIQVSTLYNEGGTANVASSASVYVKGVSGSGTTDLCIFSGAAWTCSPCAFNNTTWTRCKHENVTLTAFATSRISIGNNSLSNPAGTARSASDFYAWQGQLESGATAGPPITTVGTAATRVIEVPTIPTPNIGTAAGSGAATVVFSFTPVAGTNVAGGVLSWNSSAGRALYFTVAASEARAFDGTTQVGIAHNLTAGVAKRFAASWSGSTLTVYDSTLGTSASGSFDGALITTSPLELANGPGGAGPLNGTVKRVCIDSSPTRCR